METKYQDDATLLSALNDGDKDAFDSLFKKYYAMLCTYGCRFVSLPEAEEITQNLMISLWEKKDSIIITSSLKQYLFRSIYLGALNNISRNDIKRKVENIYYEKSIQNEYIDPYQIKELKKRLETAINKLPAPYKESFIMHRYYDLSYKEIAQKLNVSPKTVDYRIQQALKLLRQDFKDYFPFILLLL